MKTKRLVIFLFEIIGALGICLLVGVGALLVRLDHGPLPLNKVLPEIESALGDMSPGLKFRIGTARMESYRQRHAIRINLKDIIVENKDGKTIGRLQEMMLGFNWRNLLSLTYMPVVVDLLQPSIEITRYPNGYVGFNLEEVPKQEKQALSANELSDVLSRMPHDLRRVRIIGANLHYQDQVENTSLKIHDGLFDLNRSKDNVTGTMSISIDADHFQQHLEGTIAYDPDQKITRFVAALKNFKLEQVRGLVSAIPRELQLTTPMDLLLTMSVDNQARISAIDLQMAGRKGTLQYAPYFPHPVEINTMRADLHYLPIQKQLRLRHIALRLDKADLLAKGIVTKQADQNITVDLQGMVENVQVDRLKEYWPHKMATDARDWVVNRLSVGTAEQAVIDLSATISPDQKVTLDKMAGGITYKDITVNYLPPMQPVKGVSGHISYNKDLFDIHANSGLLFDTKLSRGFIRIHDLSSNDQTMDVDLKMKGPIRDAIETISSKPLEYSQKLGLVPANFSGIGDTHLFLSFPLLNDLSLSQVKMKTSAILQDMIAKNIVKDLGVSAKTLDLKVDTHHLVLQGDGQLADTNAHVVWHEYFSDDAPYTTTLQANGRLSTAVLKALHVPVDTYFTGYPASEALIRHNAAGVTDIQVKSDLTAAEITIPEFNLTKKSGIPGNLRLNLVTGEGGTVISDSSMTWPEFDVNNAALQFSATDELQSATLKKIRLGRSTADVTVTPLIGDGLRAVVSGGVIDLSDYWARPKDKDSASKPSTRRVELNLQANELYLSKETPLRKARIDVVMQGRELLRGTMSGQTDQDGSFALKQTIARDNSRHLAIKAFNAGRVFQALDITRAVRGGTLTILGASTPQAPSVIKGDMSLEKFSMIDAPILARLLNALSPGGLLNLLKTNGLAFSKMESKISLPDADTIRLSKGRLAGDSLGLSFAGNVDRKTDTLDLKGTIIPVEGLNSIANRIPVLGRILTGMKGNGIFGATYKITGPSSDPSVSVNPLSALAPGILRSIFFESSDD